MPELNTSSPLHLSPNGGEASEHSAYYRRLLSAGYKGHIQGGIGGATLYGSFGLAIGALVGIPLALATSGAALLLIPALGGLGALEGAKTFADIGSHAAIMADSAETNEKRRILLDQLHNTDDPLQQQAIHRELAAQLESKPVHKLFHWKAVAIGALIGGGLALAAITLAPHIGLGLLMPEISELLLTHMALSTTIAATVGTAIGALAGATIGIDREYVRRWLDTSESLVNDRGHMQERAPGIALAPQRQYNQPYRDAAPSLLAPSSLATAPDTSVAAVAAQGRLNQPPEIHKAVG